MKRIIAVMLLAVMALSLFSCGAKPELVEMDSEKVSDINFIVLPDAEVDKESFVKAYNSSEVKSAAEVTDKTGNNVIVVSLTNDKDVFTLYYLGDSQFCVAGTAVEKDYIIKSSELAELYENTIDPKPEFVKMEGSCTVALVKAPDKEIDTEALVQYYNNSEFIGKADSKTSKETIVVVFDDGEHTMELCYLGEDQFRVSGTLVKVDFIIESADLAKLYTEAVK